MTRNIPLREKKPRKFIEKDVDARTVVASEFVIPNGILEFKSGYRECIDMYTLHAPNKKYVGKILDDYCITLENACIRANMSRESLAQYEGYRQAIKDLKRLKKIK